VRAEAAPDRSRQKGIEMDLFEAVRKRATYRGAYKQTEVPREDLDKMVQAAIDAPSGCNAQSTYFVIIDDKNIMSELAEIVPKAGMKTAPAAIAVLSDTTPAYDDVTFYKEDYSAAVQNIYLAATALGYATCWLDGVLRRDGIADKISDLLNVPDNLITCVLLPIGIPEDEITHRDKKQFNKRACYNKYGIES